MSAHLLHQLLAETAARYPERKAIVLLDRSITYCELDRQSGLLSGELFQRGVRQGDRVGILFKRSIEAVVALFGIMRTGASYVPIDPAMPAGRMSTILQNCAIRCLLASSETAASVLPQLDGGLPLETVLIPKEIPPGLTCRNRSIRLAVWPDSAQSNRLPRDCAEITDAYPAYILHTSGSTGSPKGVAISHRNALAFIEMAVDFFDIRMEDRLANHAPLHFDLSVFDLFAAVRRGATAVIIPENLALFPIKLAEYIAEQGITVWNSVPSVLVLLARLGHLERLALDKLRLVLFAGEVFPAQYLRKLKRDVPRARIFNMYGQTEANSSTYFEIGDIPDDGAWKAPIGKPFPNYEVFALSEAGARIDRPGEEGELYVCGPTVAIGYWRNEQATASSFVPDPLGRVYYPRIYRTGDLVRLDEHGNYHFVGRKDSMVKSRGYRIELGEIEVALSGFPGITQAAAIPVPDDLIGNRIVAFVSCAAGQSVRERDVIVYAGRRVPPYMVPEKVLIRDHLPMTSTGKVDRRVLREEALRERPLQPR